MASPAVTIIMPLYNSCNFMAPSIQSVLQQTFCDFELILIDDCSDDASLAQAHIFALHDSRIRVIALAENCGSGAARNAGIAVAQGRYIAFVDSDDLWEPEKLAVQLAQMEEKKVVFSYTDYAVLMESGQAAPVRLTPERLNYHQLMKNTAIGLSTVIYDSDIVGKRYFPLLRRGEDFAMWLSILHDINYAYRCGGVLTCYRIRSGSVSSNKFKAAAFTWKVYRDLERLPFPSAAYYFANYALAATRKRL